MATRSILRQFQFVAAFLLMVLTVLTPAAAAQEPPPAESPPPFDRHFGVVDSFVNTTEANAAGAGWTRVFFRWDVIQPAGPTDWKPTNVPDTLIDAEIAAGRQVVAVLIGTPPWATESSLSTAVPPPEYWGDFVFKIATQYKGRIKHWVIWNQPDITDPASPSYTWDGSEEDYYRLLREAYRKIKAVDPQMQVHLAGLTYTWDRDRGNPQYLSRLLDIITADPQAAAENYFFDAVSYHIYYDPRQMLEITSHVRTILADHGLNKPVWINETNAPPSEDFLEPIDGAAAFSVTLEEQSAFVIQAFALGLAGGADRIAFNKLRNEPADPQVVEPYGLLRGDNSRRPAFNAFHTVTTYFAGVQDADWLQIGNIYIVTLDRGGQTTTVLWNIATTPVTFNLNAIAPEGLLVDDQGNTQPIAATNGIYAVELPAAICSNGTNCFIGSPPRLIIEQGSPGQRSTLVPAQTPVPPTPTPVPTETPLPTDTPLPPPPTVTPTPNPTATPVPTDSNVEPPTPLPESQEGAAPTLNVLPAFGDDPLPDPSIGQPEEGLSLENSDAPASTPVPPVTISTVLKPRRILWLFIIGLIVFTVSYGIQVLIWYRLRR